jgi:hypothetical protein
MPRAASGSAIAPVIRRAIDSGYFHEVYSLWGEDERQEMNLATLVAGHNRALAAETDAVSGGIDAESCQEFSISCIPDFQSPIPRRRNCPPPLQA